MSKSNLINSLFKIDAAEGLVRYVEAVKPYHSKILDVLIEYVYKEDVKVTVKERWQTDIHQFKPTTDVKLNSNGVYEPTTHSCYFQVIPTGTEAGEVGGSFLIQGWHAEKFKAGQRMRVSFSDNTAKTYIIKHAENLPDALLQNVYETRVYVSDNQIVPIDSTIVATTVLLAFTSDYRVIAATTGSSGAWIIEGDYHDEFQVGEQVILAGTNPNELGAAIYTVASAPYNGYSADHAIGVAIDYAPAFDIVALKPSTLTGNLGSYAITQGVWVVLGSHADSILPNQHISVKTNNPAVPQFYRVSSVSEMLYSDIASYDVVFDGVHHQFSSVTDANDTPPWLDSQIVYDDLGNSWTYRPVSYNTFDLFNIDNTKADGSTPISSIRKIAGYSCMPNTSYLLRGVDTNNDGILEYQSVTVIVVSATQEIPTTAQPVGKLKSPVVPRYEVIDKTNNTWTVAGRFGKDATASDYSAPNISFRPNDRIFMVDNDYDAADREYVVASAINDATLNQTVITVVGTIATGATISGHIQHPTIVTTIIPVVEPVFEYAYSGGEYYKTFKQGTMRYLPQVFNQVTEPTTTVMGAVWVDPVTNISKRWSGSQWVYNYTPTNYSWVVDRVNKKKSLIITSATAQDGDHNNTFVVDTTGLFESYTFSTISLSANQFMFSKSFSIVGVNHVANKWIVQGNASVIPGEVIYITSSSARYGIGKYTVASVTHLASTTEIYVTRQISRMASPDGYLAVPSQAADIPAWVEGTRVKVSGDLPNPLADDTPYYFIPVIKPFESVTIETPPIFALATKRRPMAYEDYVDITTLGTGVLTLVQDEVFVPGSIINVRDTFNSRNNGTYTIIDTLNESATSTRIRVAERIRSTTPSSMARDGVVEYDLDSHVFSSLTERKCKADAQSELHAATTITEHIEFVFSIEEFDYIAAHLAENEDPQQFVQNTGWDIDGNDMSGWDGTLMLMNNEAASGVGGRQTFIYNMIPVGFDTQYFDVGGIDETLQSVAKKYGKTVG